MRKFIVFIYFLTIASFTFAQQKQISGVATYRVRTVAKTSVGEMEKLLLHTSPHGNTLAEQLSFALSFTDEQAGFEYIDNNLKVSDSDLRFAKLNVGYSDYIWQDINRSYTRTQEGFGAGRKDVLLYREKTSNHWTITDEVKMIGDFLCIKATMNEVTERGSNRFVKPVIAWFCPEIPVPFGPLHYGNLPGLILELQTESALFGATKIEFHKEIQIPDLPDLDKFTEKGLIERLQKMIDSTKN